MGAVLPELGKSFAMQPGAAVMVQLIGGIVAPVFALASPIAGRLVVRYGVKSVLIGSLGVIAVGGAGPAAASSLLQILILRVLLAIGVAGGFNAGLAGIAQVPENQRPVLLGLLSFIGGAIAIAVFPLVGRLAAQDWHLPFLVHLILIPIALLALALPGATDRPERTTAVRSSGNGLLAGLPVVIVLIAAVVGLVMVSMSLYSPFHLTTVGATGPAAIGRILGVVAICSLLGSGSYPFLHRRLHTRGMVVLGLAAMTAGELVVAISSSVTIATIGLGILGAGIAIFSSAIYAASIEAVGNPAASAAAMGVVSFAMYGSPVLFPAIAIGIGDQYGTAAVYFLLAALLAVALSAYIGLRSDGAKRPALPQT
jgi:MFS family permease